MAILSLFDKILVHRAIAIFVATIAGFTQHRQTV